MAKLIYLDFAGSHPVRSEILAEHADRCRAHVANPHASSWISERSRREMTRAENRLLGLLGIPLGEARVIWTSGGTEADNLAVKGTVETGVDTVLVDGGAHAAMLKPCQTFGGNCLEWRLTAGGQPNLDPLDAAATASVRLVATCHVNNETGAVTDLDRVRQWMSRAAPRALLAVDGVQSFTKMDIPWQEAGLDLLVLSGRKIGGPASTGALIVRRGVELRPLFHGGGQQGGARPGTMDVVGILEFVRAAELGYAERATLTRRIRTIHARLRAELSRLVHPSVALISPDQGSPFIFTFALPGYEGAILMRMLAERNVLVATGSACRAESKKASHVLAAMGISPGTARGVLRVSFGSSSTEEDVAILMERLREAISDY